MTQDLNASGWRYRAVNATRGNQTMLGCILLAVINRPAKNPPWFGPTCVINPEGVVLSNFVDRHNTMHVALPVCTVPELVDEFRRLADTCNMTDSERQEMVDELRKWVSVDYRADPEYDATRAQATALLGAPK